MELALPGNSMSRVALCPAVGLRELEPSALLPDGVSGMRRGLVVGILVS